jgi:hypothetical protein
MECIKSRYLKIQIHTNLLGNSCSIMTLKKSTIRQFIARFVSCTSFCFSATKNKFSLKTLLIIERREDIRIQREQKLQGKMFQILSRKQSLYKVSTLYKKRIHNAPVLVRAQYRILLRRAKLSNSRCRSLQRKYMQKRSKTTHQYIVLWLPHAKKRNLSNNAVSQCLRGLLSLPASKHILQNNLL